MSEQSQTAADDLSTRPAGFQWRPRLRAALVHLAASGALAAGVAALVFGVWYPWPYSVLAGGTGLFVLITGVDITLGPLITLAIFDRRKPTAELRRDLVVVVALQLAALAYGAMTMFEARPVALALERDRFRLARAVDVVVEELPMAPPSLQRLSITGPVTVRTEPPRDAKAQAEAIDRALAGTDLGLRPQFWRPWDAAAAQQAVSAGKPLKEALQRLGPGAAELRPYIERTGRPVERLKALPVLSRFAGGMILVDDRSGEVVGYLPVEF